MRAAIYDRNGPAREVLTIDEVETPGPGPGEVRVRLRASGINPSDVKTRAGTTRPMVFERVIPHSDGAGDIDAVGDGVPRTRLGERVWTWNAQWRRPFGTAAAFVVLPSEQAVPLAAPLGYEVGACFGIPAMTASHAVELAAPRPNQTVLISGGAGAVSQYAIQFAKSRGARVIATVSSDEKARLVERLGADAAINYRTEDVAASVQRITAGRGVDHVIELDLSANAKLIPGVVRPRGSVVVYGTGPVAEIPAVFCLVNTIELRFFLVYELSPEERARAVNEINGAAEALVHTVARVLPLDRIVEGHELVESGRVIGNVVLSIE